ncbi:hypothetical protein [Luteimonas vadosa]|uniref:Uncharacterized protein n=1 Tax=Luteimonas vadosa TaxID=1165507 RepID=A0ABP9E8A9_9GAMM
MPRTSANGFKALVLVAFLAAIVGGVWLGLFSCGTYAWHKQAMLWMLLAFAVAILLWPRGRSPAIGRKSILSLAILGAFYFARALAAPFYPAPPDFGDYFRLVWLALATGPC